MNQCRPQMRLHLSRRLMQLCHRFRSQQYLRLRLNCRQRKSWWQKYLMQMRQLRLKFQPISRH